MSQVWKEWHGKDPNWCPGCGDFGVLRAMQLAAADMDLDPKDTVLVTGIGCSGNITSSFRSYGFHGIHGRALPAATGIKLANPALTVLVAGGDGDGFGIGLGHFMHAARRNVDVTYIVMDNQVYGLTKGQASPTTDASMTTKASPLGPQAEPVNPLELAMAAGASFVAQGYSADQKGLVELIKAGVAHRGFALINVQSPCVTYNLLNTYAWYKDNIHNLTDHNANDRAAALLVAQDRSRVPVGLLYQTKRPVLAPHAGIGPGAVESAADPSAAMAAADAQFAAWSARFQVR